MTFVFLSESPEADGGDLCETERDELAKARFSGTPQPKPSYSETFHAAKTFFFLPCPQLKSKKLRPFQKDDPFLKYTTVEKVKDVVSGVTCRKDLKAFSLKESVLSTQEVVGATSLAKLFTLIKAAWCYDVPFPRCQKFQAHTYRQIDTHTQTRTE